MKIVLASKSGVRKDILNKNDIKCDVCPSNVNEDEVKNSLISTGASPLLISKNLAELKSNKISLKKFRRWYEQSGTPKLKIQRSFKNGNLEIKFSQKQSRLKSDKENFSPFILWRIVTLQGMKGV